MIRVRSGIIEPLPKLFYELRYNPDQPRDEQGRFTFGSGGGSSGKGVDKNEKSDIIELGSDTLALENQRYGRNKKTLVNKTYLESGEYRRKFDNATDNANVNKSLYDCSKTALKHRNGTAYEDMYWIDGESGKVLHSVLDSKEERTIKNDSKIENAIKGHDNVITLHTHPSSMPPSAADLNSCYSNGYKTGFVACHNGRVFGYTSNEIINERLNDMYIQRYINEGHDEFNALMKALEKMSETYDIKVWEVDVK